MSQRERDLHAYPHRHGNVLVDNKEAHGAREYGAELGGGNERQRRVAAEEEVEKVFEKLAHGPRRCLVVAIDTKVF